MQFQIKEIIELRSLLGLDLLNPLSEGYDSHLQKKVNLVDTFSK